jgi:hypothetical protein
MAARTPTPFVDSLIEKIDDARLVETPRVASFRQFLQEHAQVKITHGPDTGRYQRYGFTGREALIAVVDTLDAILGHAGDPPLKDSKVVLAGGAQFGKTILELNLAAYMAGCRFLSPGVYMPDDKLADGIVDTKFRPDVLDQIPWLARMTQVGRAVNKSGKAVNTKGAFMVTDGDRRANGLFRGLQRTPTSFSLDAVIEDEKDDIPRDKAKFLSGRLTASALRLHIVVGTQRIHGAGQNREFEDGSQGVMLIGPQGADLPSGLIVTLHDEHCLTVRDVPPGWLNPEEQWPQVCRLAVTGTPRRDDPQLTHEGDFRGGRHPHAIEGTPDAVYYLADPKSGVPLDRARVAWHHRRPDRVARRRWSFRMSQMGTPAIDLAQIVAHWSRAVGDSDEMRSFCCDRLARPKSAAQAITPQILDRARLVRPYQYLPAKAGPRFAGLDTGDRCWLVIREKGLEGQKRLVRADQIALGDVVQRVRNLCEQHAVECLCIDERPAVDEARRLAMMLNGLDQVTRWPRVNWGDRSTYVTFPGGLTWDGRNQIWRGLRCAVVRFSKRALGDGVEHAAAEFQEDGVTKFVPLIATNRYETIDGAVRELLTPEENVHEVVRLLDGRRQTRQTPSLLLPSRVPGSPAILETFDQHLLAGSQREKDPKTSELGDYVDGCDNHLLLADAYSRLAEANGGSTTATGPTAASTVRRQTLVRRGRGMPS